MARIPVAIQMYTLRDQVAEDYEGTYRKVAEIGYEGVQGSPKSGMTGAEYKAFLDELGLTTPGGHTGLGALEDNLQSVIDLHHAIDAKYVTLSSMPQDRRKTGDDWKRAAENMTAIGKKLADAGIVLCYHNHAFEFETFDGKYGLDILYDNSDPQYVQAEIDTYWVQKGGVDPAAYIRKLSGRTPLIHIKDMDTDGDFAEIGEGTLDWDAIWSACEASGAKWYIVEQDRCKRPPVESATLSVNNLCKMGKLD
ncbi:MAG: sugar phosphate isomerase/epimerase [Candidatus Poribacteria bacterium]|nr:sugar phosphate isomerase/epimerase [Candidatus Poribacteria bacterium]